MMHNRAPFGHIRVGVTRRRLETGQIVIGEFLRTLYMRDRLLHDRVMAVVEIEQGHMKVMVWRMETDDANNLLDALMRTEGGGAPVHRDDVRWAVTVVDGCAAVGSGDVYFQRENDIRSEEERDELLGAAKLDRIVKKSSTGDRT